VALTFKNNGTIWDIQFNSDFSDALMGNMTEAIRAFNDSTDTSDMQLIEPRY
jgi:hypothetical protein